MAFANKCFVKTLLLLKIVARNPTVSRGCFNSKTLQFAYSKEERLQRKQ